MLPVKTEVQAVVRTRNPKNLWPACQKLFVFSSVFSSYDGTEPLLIGDLFVTLHKLRVRR